MSAAARPSYGLSYGTADMDAPTRSEWVSDVLPLLLLVIGLALATIWFVALPALETQPAGRACEVFVLESGKTKCVPKPGTRAVPAKTNPFGRTGS